MNPNNGFTPPPYVTLTLPNGQSQNVYNLRYDGSSDFGDYYAGNDLDGKAIRWAIEPNSYDVERYKEGSLSGFTAADLTPAYVSRPADTSADVLTRPVASDPLHVYVRTENGRDFWRMEWGGGVYTWQTPVGQTSASIIQDTYGFVAGPVTQTTGTVTAPAVITGADGNVTVTTPPTDPVRASGASNQVTGSGQGGGGPNGSASGGLVRAVPPADAGPRSSTAHVYVGRDSRGDVWQIFDGTNVIEWAVEIGEPSAALIDGTLRNLGAPSAGTVAQAAPTVAPSTPAAKAVEDAKGTLWLSAAALAAKLLIFS
jgi:hypothetical protein